MKRIKRKTIVNRISNRVALALIISITFLTIFDVIYMGKSIMNEQMTELDLATRLISDQVDDFTADMMTVTEDMASSLTALGAIDDVTVRGVIDRVTLNHPEYYYVYFADKLGNITMARGVEFAPGVDPRERVWYKSAEAAGHSVVIDPYISATSPDVIMSTVATPVYWGSMMVGVVAVDANIQTIKDFMDTIDFENGAYGFLLDSQGNYIVHPKEEFNPTTEKVVNIDEVRPELRKALDKAGNDFVYSKDYRGVDMVFYAADLETSKWTVVVAYPRKNVLNVVYRGVLIALIVALLSMLIALIDIRRMIRSILSPIGKIGPAMERIINGDFTTKLNFATHDDEIGDLQNTMAMLIADLSDIIEAEKHVLGEMERGNLTVEDIDELPGDLNEISKAVNSIKESFNDIISDIQFSAINLQSFAMGINETSDLDDMRMVFEKLSAEANALMDKTSRFNTGCASTDNSYEYSNEQVDFSNDYQDDF